jgi:ribosomal protein S6
MKKTKYQATFVLDTSTWRDSIENLTESLKTAIQESSGTVLDVQDLGLIPLARTPRREFVRGHFVCIQFESESDHASRTLNEKMRLNQNVNRLMIERMGA